MEKSEVIKLRDGNLINFDQNEFRMPPKMIQIGIVQSVLESEVLFQGEFKRRFDRCCGIPLTDKWLTKYPVLNAPYFRFVHELQNWHFFKFGSELKLNGANYQILNFPVAHR